MIVCLCEGVSQRKVADAVAHGARSLDRLTRATGAGSSCGSCHNALRDLLATHAAAMPSHDRAALSAPGLKDAANPR